MKNPMVYPIAGTITVLAAYMMVRSVIYFLIPDSSLEAWFFRDDIMSLPRLAAFGTLLFLNRTWRSPVFDWQLRDSGRAGLFCGLLVVIIAFFYYSGSVGPKLPWFVAAGRLFTTVPVALNEEYAFRGPWLTRLCRRYSPRMGILLSSGLFTVFHLQAQPFSRWGAIFLIGAILANLRVKRLSLGWLILTHFVVDVLWIFFRRSPPEITSFNGIVYQIALLAYALALFPYGQKRMCLESVAGTHD